MPIREESTDYRLRSRHPTNYRFALVDAGVTGIARMKKDLTGRRTLSSKKNKSLFHNLNVRDSNALTTFFEEGESPCFSKLIRGRGDV